MVGESLGDRAGLAFFQSLNLLEERDEGLRIVASAIHVLHAQVVGLRLELARKLHECDRHAQRGGFIHSVTRPTTDQDQRNRAELRIAHARHLPHRVMGANVSSLMSHHRGQFRLFVGVHNQAGVNEKESARERKCVDLVRIDHLDGERHLAVRVPHNVLADAVHVFGHHRIGDEPGALLDLGGVHPAHLDLGIVRVPVAHPAATNVAIAHGIHVVDGARLHAGPLATRLDYFVGIDGNGRDLATGRCGSGRSRRGTVRGRRGDGHVASHRRHSRSRLRSRSRRWDATGWRSLGRGLARRSGLCPNHSGQGKRQSRQRRCLGSSANRPHCLTSGTNPFSQSIARSTL